MNLENAIRLAADLTKTRVRIAVPLDLFVQSPDAVMAIGAIQQALAESLNGGKLHAPQSALKFDLLVDAQTVGEAEAIANAAAAAMPEASDHEAKLHVEWFEHILLLPHTADEVHTLVDLVNATEGVSVQPGIFGAVIGEKTWATMVGHALTTHQGYAPALIGIPATAPTGTQALQGALRIIRAIAPAVETGLEAQAHPRLPDELPPGSRTAVDEPPFLPPPADFQQKRDKYVASMLNTLKAVRRAS